MKKTFALLLLLSCTAPALFAGQRDAYGSEAGKVALLSPYWRFPLSYPGQSQLGPATPEASLSLPGDLTKGFTIRFTADLKAVGKTQTLLEIPGVLHVGLRPHDAKDRKNQNYPAHKMPDGAVPVLEAALSLESPAEPGVFQDMIVGIPLAILDKPEGKHTVILRFSGVEWSLYVDDRLYDNDFPLGYPSVGRMKSWKLNPAYVSEAVFYEPALRPERMAAPRPQPAPSVQYWTPDYPNAWVGDVVSFYHNNRYHVFYLFDRRGHASKFGKGGHYFEHLSTTDFTTWVEHEPATPIEHQWETLGTGTPFLYEGRLCISYGLHTTRMYPKEKTTLPLQWDYLNEHGHTGSFNYDTMPGLIPAGSTYSISADGVTNFKKTHILYHPCENPSIYTDPEGRLKMLANYGAKGTWGADSVGGGWKCLNAGFPLGGDCTFFFRWGGYDYIIGGFSRLWSKPADEGDEAYQDVVAEGADFYNGLSVPAVTEIPGGRFLMAGWLKMQQWGGPLVIHELIQYPDGRIGTKWMDELTPATGTPVQLAVQPAGKEPVSVSDPSFLLTFDVCPDRPGKGKLGVVFLPEQGEKEACEWQLRLDKARAQFAAGSLAGYAAEEKTLREGGEPHAARDYAIENGIDTNRPVTVRMVVRSSDKFGGSLIDAEIAGQRTMLTYRPELTARRLHFRTEGVSLRNIRIAPLRE